MSFSNDDLKRLIPDSVFSATRDGTTDFETVERTVQNVVEQVSHLPTVPSIPSVSPVGVLRRLLPKIPTVNLPTRAQLQRYVIETIDRKKQEQQERLLVKVLADEVLEQSPFTARKTLINKLSRVRPR